MAHVSQLYRDAVRVFFKESDALHRETPLLAGPSILVLTSFIHQGWQSLAHGSSNVVVDFEVLQFIDPKSTLDVR